MQDTLGVAFGELLSTAFVESAVKEIVAKLMNKNSECVRLEQSDDATLLRRMDCEGVLSDTFESTFRRRYLGFRPRTTTRQTAAA